MKISAQDDKYQIFNTIFLLVKKIPNKFPVYTIFEARDSGPLLHLEKLAPENLIAPHDDATVSYPPSLRCFSSFGDREIIGFGRAVKFYHREIRVV